MSSRRISEPQSFPDLEKSQTTPQWDPFLVQTLPFDRTQANPASTERILKRSRDRWEWFSDAQKADPALGTLSYLPYEIRQLIFVHTLACRPTLSADGPWEYDYRLGPPLNVSAYYFGENGRATIDSRINGLRLASSSIKAEYEDVLLSKRTFRFNDPDSLMSFITRLNNAQLSRVFSIAIGVCILYQMESWLKPIGQLPSSLSDVQFQIYTAFNDYFQPDSLSILKGVVKEAVRRAPHAGMSICGTGQEPLTQECLDFAHDFLPSLSPERRSPRNCETEKVQGYAF